MNKDFLRANVDERPQMIVLGICLLFLLIFGFILYLFFLHRISLTSMIVSSLVFSLIYIPRFKILWKLKNKDTIKVDENSLSINNQKFLFDDILDFIIQKKKPQVVFFINNSMVVFNEATFILHTKNGDIFFTVIGEEKINLLSEFLKKVI